MMKSRLIKIYLRSTNINCQELVSSVEARFMIYRKPTSLLSLHVVWI